MAHEISQLTAHPHSNRPQAMGECQFRQLLVQTHYPHPHQISKWLVSCVLDSMMVILKRMIMLTLEIVDVVFTSMFLFFEKGFVFNIFGNKGPWRRLARRRGMFVKIRYTNSRSTFGGRYKDTIAKY